MTSNATSSRASQFTTLRPTPASSVLGRPTVVLLVRSLAVLTDGGPIPTSVLVSCTSRSSVTAKNGSGVHSAMTNPILQAPMVMALDSQCSTGPAGRLCQTDQVHEWPISMSWNSHQDGYQDECVFSRGRLLLTWANFALIWDIPTKTNDNTVGFDVG